MLAEIAEPCEACLPCDICRISDILCDILHGMGIGAYGEHLAAKLTEELYVFQCREGLTEALSQAGGVYLYALAVLCEDAEAVGDDIVKSAYIRLNAVPLLHVAEAVGKVAENVESVHAAHLVDLEEVAFEKVVDAVHGHALIVYPVEVLLLADAVYGADYNINALVVKLR